MVLAVLPRDQRQGRVDEWALKPGRDTRVLWGTLAPWLPRDSSQSAVPCCSLSLSCCVHLYWKEGPPKLQKRTKATGGQPLLPETGKTICYGNSTLQGVALLCEVGGGPFRVSSKHF